MRRDCLHLFPLISILLLFPTLSYGQAWSGILSSSRAINWSNAGLPATLPDGETTPNPWTPPTRKTICATLNPVGGGSDDGPQILSAIAGCANGTVVLLNPGTFTILSNTMLSPGYTSGHNNVTVRGSGPMSTTVNLSGSSAYLQLGASATGGPVPLTSAASNYTVGSTSIIVMTASPPVAGEIGYINQCDTGYTGTPCAGTHADNGGIYICGNDHICDTELNGDIGSNNIQWQTVLITSVNANGSGGCSGGAGTYCIGISPGLYMPNWAYAQSPLLNWKSPAYVAIGMGLEDMTITENNAYNQAVTFGGAYASWIKGVRFVGAGSNRAVAFSFSKNCLFVNNYIYANTPTAFSSSATTAINQGQDSDDLILNNILVSGIAVEGEGNDEGIVIAYNYNRDVLNTYYQSPDFQHSGEANFILREGNQFYMSEEDDTWSTHNFNTYFRSYISCWDSPYVTGTNNPRGIQFGNYVRFDNIIGGAYGGACTAYQGTSVGDIYDLAPTDTLSTTSLMRWGNCDTVTGTCRFQSSEVPTSLSSPNVALSNPVPSSTTLPASFFMSATAHPSGGTGLGWWKVCKTWTTFPTACATTQTQPFPPVGPDVTGGPYVNGTAYDIPAAIAFRNLPIDATYQNSYSITSSSWSSGTETLTVSGLPSSALHIMGGFQITGVAGCNSAAGAEFLMTGSTTTTISYALASSPGSCAGGTMLFPDVRQFDERVYENDSPGDPPQGPTGLQAVVQ